MTEENRYTVVEHDGRPGATGEPVTIYRVFDSAVSAYPVLMSNGYRVQDHYSARDHAQRVADKLNTEVE